MDQVQRAGSVVDLTGGWAVVQDVHDLGEELGLFRRDWDPYRIGQCVSDWQPLDRLKHLQLLLADQPYFGRQLRYFNAAPWWYRLRFATPAGTGPATLRFGGVDYFAKVWLNERLLGEHEGHAEPFEFEVGNLLAKDGSNCLVVKVWSPWDRQVVPGREGARFWAVVRNLIKGGYEHADTFVQRDVNPVGIWRPVLLAPHDGMRAAGKPLIQPRPADDGRSACVRITWPVALDEGTRPVRFEVRIIGQEDRAEVARCAQDAQIVSGQTVLAAEATIPNPRLWSTWDRGTPHLYRAELCVAGQGATGFRDAAVFGVRQVALRRTKEETTFLLNGRPLFLRGTTYWSDVYTENAGRERFERDVAAMVKAGINAVRIHVHEEDEAFYDVCDRMGVLVFQDFDLNWTFPTDGEFTRRAVRLFGGMVRRLHNHPSIGCWICMNEAARHAGAGPGFEEHDSNLHPGTDLLTEARRVDPDRPTIRNSGHRDDPESGDGHDYRGSLQGGHYLDIHGSKEKLATEFGVDAPPAAAQAARVPWVARRLVEVLPRVAELHDYQYHLTKYYLEHYRIQKYAPCSGYFQFTWSDFCPQSFYGLHDYWGSAKAEGIGGGLKALQESNMPVGVFMEYKDAPIALHAANDLPSDMGPCQVRWTVEDRAGRETASGRAEVALAPDCRRRVCDLSFPVADGLAHRVTLTLHAAGGEEIARNVYRDPFNPPAHPAGHPKRMDHELGMRLWWAGGGAERPCHDGARNDCHGG